jgi:sterol desaturase/sphingolipid hydroxylase (fatty acid hydroxylase superfamily)
MSSNHILYLNVNFIILGLVFTVLEYFFPDRVVNKKREGFFDAMAFIVLCLAGIYISQPLINFFYKVRISFFQTTPFFPSIIKIIFATLLTDFLNYWIHYYMHKYNWFWRTHVLHHQIQELYWFSGLRASLNHYISFIFSRSIVGVLILGLNSFEMLVFFTIGLIGSNLQHANISLPWKYIEWLIISPRIHRLHHSENGRRMKNLGAIFSIWDRLFKTYSDPDKEIKDYKIGVKKTSNNQIRDFIGI